MLLVSPDSERTFDIKIIGETLDLNCGQAVDRAGVMMGLSFPCGKELEALALKSSEKYNPKVCVNGGNCSLSGLENQCRKMLDNGESKQLWYEEIVPHESVFYTIVIGNDEKTLNIFINALNDINNIVQFGGNASVGYGLCRVTVTEG